MTEISPEAQALIDRLARMDPANPRHDKAAIERAINAHLEALGMPLRSFAWADDPETGFRYLKRHYRAAIRRARIRIFVQTVLNNCAVAGSVWLGSFLLFSLLILITLLFMTASGEVEHASWFELAWEATLAGTIYGTCFAILVGGVFAGAHAAWPAIRDAVDDRNFVRSAAGDPVLTNDEIAVVDELRGLVWPAVEAAVMNESMLGMAAHPAAYDALDAVAAVIGRNAELARIWLPIVDAFEAGLFLYWITRCEVVCVLQPSLSIVNGRLHCAAGPAVLWPSGKRYHFWRGIQVPAWIVEEPEKISVEVIRKTRNQEIRRCMTEIYGLSRYLRDAGATLVHEDECGRLWEARVGEETWRVVEVENGTPEPDGTRRIYTLDVTDAAEDLGWPIETARAAVAATYGLRPEEYRPELRT